MAELASGNSKAMVPWGSLQGHEEDYVDNEYVPKNFTFKEPSKLTKVECYERVKFWYDRQENPTIKKVFQYRSIRGPDGNLLQTKMTGNDKRGSRKAKNGKSKGFSSDERSSDTGGHSSSEDGALPESSEEEVSQVMPLPFSAVPIRRRGAPVKKSRAVHHQSPPQNVSPLVTSLQRSRPKPRPAIPQNPNNPEMSYLFTNPRSMARPAADSGKTSEAGPSLTAREKKRRNQPEEGPQYEPPNTRKKRWLQEEDRLSPMKKTRMG